MSRKEQLLDDLTGALIGLARVCSSNPKTEQTGTLLLEGLSVLALEDNLSGTDTDGERTSYIKELTEKIRGDKYTISPNCKTCQTPCGNTDDYDLDRMRQGDEGMMERKLHILKIEKELAAVFSEAGMEFPEALQMYLLKGLYAVAEEWSDDYFLDIIEEGEGYLSRLR